MYMTYNIYVIFDIIDEIKNKLNINNHRLHLHIKTHTYCIVNR